MVYAAFLFCKSFKFCMVLHLPPAFSSPDIPHPGRESPIAHFYAFPTLFPAARLIRHPQPSRSEELSQPTLSFCRIRLKLFFVNTTH